MHQQSTWCAWGYTLAPTGFHPGVSTICKKHLGSEIPSIWHLKSSTDHETVWVCDLCGSWSWSKDRMSSREPGGSPAPQRPSSLQGHLSKVFLGGTSCLSVLVLGWKHRLWPFCAQLVADIALGGTHAFFFFSAMQGIPFNTSLFTGSRFCLESACKASRDVKASRLCSSSPVAQCPNNSNQ